ncbi:hypothetical protein AB0J81_29955 [Streptomyces bobili]|uniref:hypothetical protein n=1 Tax=Streptomyces bobili TaxID=67280 RepID=UPI003432B4EF
MTGQPRPWHPEDFDDHCETCGAPPCQLCNPWCNTGYTTDDYRRDAQRQDRTAHRPTPGPPTSRPRM